MEKRALEYRIASNKIPKFIFNPIDLKNDSGYKQEILSIYTQGLISKETAIEELGFDFDQELERKKEENKEKLDQIFTLPPSFNNQAAGENGRPSNNDGTTDKDKSASSNNQPKPSTT
jgi:hypothetical protein